jgi:PAS domain S-box-containing protein
LEEKQLIPDLSDDARYRLIVEAITGYAIYMLDVNGNVSSWNSGAQHLNGYEAAEIIGQHFSCFCTAEGRKGDVPARDLATARRAGRFKGEGWRLRNDGTKFWAHVVIDSLQIQRVTSSVTRR